MPFLVPQGTCTMQKLSFMKYLIPSCLALALSNSAVAAGLYKWIDKDGKVNYSTTRPVENEVSKEYSGGKISLNFNEVDLAKLFAIFADFSRNRINIDPSIKQTVAVHYFDVEWEPTMYEIAERYKLDVKVENGTIYVKKRGSR